MCAFTFCWWANADFLEENVPPEVVLEREEEDASTSTAGAERGKKEDREELATSFVLARGAEAGKEVAGAVRNAMALLESVLQEAPTRGVERVA